MLFINTPDLLGNFLIKIRYRKIALFRHKNKFAARLCQQGQQGFSNFVDAEKRLIYNISYILAYIRKCINCEIVCLEV